MNQVEYIEENNISKFVPFLIGSKNMISEADNSQGRKFTKADLTDNVLREEYCNNLLSIEKIAKKYSFTSEIVRNRLRVLDIALIHNRAFRSRQNWLLTDVQQELIFGSLCGDATIDINISGSSNFIVTHSMKQLDYLIWKADILRNWIPFSVPYKTQFQRVKLPQGTELDYTRCEIWTYVAPIFNELRSLFYPNGIKIISRDILYQLTPFSLAVWFMDDGSKDEDSMNISGCWSSNEVIDITDWFATIHNIRVKFYHNTKNKDNGSNMNFSPTQARKLNDIIAPFIIPSMQYKLLPQRLHAELLQ